MPEAARPDGKIRNTNTWNPGTCLDTNSTLGAISGSTNTLLRIGAGASLFVDDPIATRDITLDRGKIIFDAEGAFYTGAGTDKADATTNVIAAMQIDPKSKLIVNDGTSGSFNRDLSGALYSHLLTNMDIVFNDDPMRTARVETVTSFALGDGHRLTGPESDTVQINRLFAITGGGVNDLLQLVGAGSDLALGGELRVFDLGLNSFLGRTTNDYWTLALYTGSLLSSNLALNSLYLPGLDPGLTWTLDTTFGGEIRLAIVVPEPNTWMLLLMGVGLVAVLARRRRASR